MNKFNIPLTKPRYKRKYTKIEDGIQVACVKWFRLTYPESKGYIIASFSNGGSRNIVEAVNLKKAGLRAGMPDLIIFDASGGYHALLIEMKGSKKNKLSDSQKEIHPMLLKKNYKVEVCCTIDEFMSVVNNYLKN